MTNGSLTFWIVIAAASAAFRRPVWQFLFHEGPAVLGVTYGTCIGVLAIAYERGACSPGTRPACGDCPPWRTSQRRRSDCFRDRRRNVRDGPRGPSPGPDGQEPG